MTSAEKVNLETKAMLVESEYYDDVTYAIDRQGRGMWLIVGKQVVAISEPIDFVKELFEVWQHMKPRGCEL